MHRHESKFVQKIVQEVSSKLNPRYMNVATYPVGIDSQVKDIIAMLSVGTNEVRTVGIYGMPGIGKTAIAKAVFNQLCHKFEGSCFLLNIRKSSDQHNGLVQLQEQLLFDSLTGKIWLADVDAGINGIKSQFCRKRVLVILDDFDQSEQIHAFVGERGWFGPGSRIVITTRDEHLLTQLEVVKKYPAKELNHEESLQLFSWHAFREPHPVTEYVELSKVLVDYVGGVPLALEVLGSYLFRRSIPQWTSAIEKLKKIPHHQIQRQLKTSFDDLDGDKLKDMFLDIACFFIGMDKDYVGKILDGRGFYPEIDINILRERSLLTVNSENKLQMHNLLRDMGREIIRQMDPNPGKRSRLWLHEDVMEVLGKCSVRTNCSSFRQQLTKSFHRSFPVIINYCFLFNSCCFLGNRSSGGYHARRSSVKRCISKHYIICSNDISSIKRCSCKHNIICTNDVFTVATIQWRTTPRTLRTCFRGIDMALLA